MPSLGSSDHDIVFHEISMPIGRPLQPKRNIKLFGKANWEQFTADINLFKKLFNRKTIQTQILYGIVLNLKLTASQNFIFLQK